MSDRNENPEIDWVHLPTECDVQSLWDCLHDGELLSCTSDLLNRTVRLEFDIYHLREEMDDVKFVVLLELVTSVRVNVFVTWPGEFEVPGGVTREEESRLIAEYQAKWREESLGWNKFESSLETDPLVVTNAMVACTDGRAALQLNGHLDGEKFNDQYCSVYIRCGGISASRTDGRPFSLQQLLDMGHEYWEAFAARRIARDSQG